MGLYSRDDIYMIRDTMEHPILDGVDLRSTKKRTCFNCRDAERGHTEQCRRCDMVPYSGWRPGDMQGRRVTLAEREQGSNVQKKS